MLGNYPFYLDKPKGPPSPTSGRWVLHLAFLLSLPRLVFVAPVRWRLGLPGEPFHERQRDELNDNIDTIAVNAMTETSNQLGALRRASDAEMFEAIEIISSILDLPRSPTEEPDCLPLSDIVEIPSVFQVRGEQTDEHHAGALLDVLKRGADLKPVTVCRCGDGAVLIDGHHRLHAYRRLKGRDRGVVTVPVVWFRGGLDEAIRAAAEANNDGGHQ